MQKILFEIISYTSMVWLGLFIIKRTFFGEYIIKKPPRLITNGYKLFYTDQSPKKKEKGVIYSKLLVSKKYGLKGKPDFILKHRVNNMLMPIELKSGKIGDNASPRYGDLMQLCAYFLIVEDIFKVKPAYGKLIYSDHMFVVKNTRRLRKQLLSIMSDMRLMLKTGEQQPKANYATCRYCLSRNTVCEFCEE